MRLSNRATPRLDKFTSDFIWNTASLAVVGFVGLGLNVLILAVRGKASLGVFNLVLTVYVILSQIAACGVHFSVLNQCSRHSKDLDFCRRSVFSALLLVLGISSLIALLLYLLSNPLADLFDSKPMGEGVRCISWGVVFFSVNKVLLLLLNALRHMRAMAVFQALRFVLMIVFVTVGLHIGASDGRLPLAVSLAELFLAIAITVYVRLRIFRFNVAFDGQFRKQLSKHFHFGIRGVLSGLLVETNTRTDILMLGFFLSEEFVGIYSFVAAFGEGFAQLIIVMRRNLDPLLGQYLARNAVQEIHQLSQKVHRRFYPVMALGGLVLIVGFPFLLQTINEVGPWQPYWYVLIILVSGYVLISGYNCFIGIFLQGGAPGTFTILMLITVVSNVILNAILIPIFGIFGAATATAIAYGIQTAVAIILARRLFGVRL